LLYELVTDEIRGFTDTERIYGRYTGLWTEISLRAQNTVVSFVGFASNLYAALPVALTIVHFDSTPIHSLHTSRLVNS